MGLFDFFFSKKAIQQTIHDQSMGIIVWSGEEKSWCGSCNGVQFQIVREAGQDSSSSELMAYARKILSGKFLQESLEKAKGDWVNRYPLAKDEIDILRYELLSIYLYKNENRIWAELGPEFPDRCWRMEYHDFVCEGLGFDS